MLDDVRTLNTAEATALDARTQALSTAFWARAFDEIGAVAGIGQELIVALEAQADLYAAAGLLTEAIGYTDAAGSVYTLVHGRNRKDNNPRIAALRAVAAQA